jgi:hypothetical protein
MKKIQSLFVRNYNGNRQVINEIVPGSEWVLNGEGTATVKWDGTSVLIQYGVLYKRYDAKKGKPLPNGFIPAQEPDEVTGHYPGWAPCDENAPEDQYHFEAFTRKHNEDGTYELVGPKIQGNPEGLTCHELFRHGDTPIYGVPLSFDGIRDFLKNQNIEGIVWHHSDGRMVKIKKKDFGFKRNSK